MDKTQLKTLGLAFGRSVQTAYKAVVMYSVDHPAALRFLQQAYESLKGLLAAGPQFTYGYANHRLLLNDLLTDEPSLAQLDAEFTRRGIAGITFLGGISLEEFKQALSILGAKPKDIDAEGGIAAYLVKHPVSRIRVIPAKQQEGEDTVLSGDTESYLKGEQGAGGAGGAGGAEGEAMGALLRFAQMEGRLDALQGGGAGLVELAGKATEAALLGQAGDPQGVMGAMARLMDEVTPDRFLSGLPPGKQATLRGRPAEEIAADVVEDMTAGLVASRLAAAPPGPLAAQAESEAVRVMTIGLSMTRMADRLLQKLEHTLREAKQPPEVFERIRQGILWNGLSQAQQRDQLLQATAYDDQTFQRLLGYVRDCLQAGKIPEAVEAATHYFGFLDSPSAAMQAELPRSLELLRIMAEPPSLSFVAGIADRLCGELLEEQDLTPQCHAVVAECLAGTVQMVVFHGDFEMAHRVGTVLEQSLARDAARHAGCCGQARARLLPPEAAGRLIDQYMEKRGDAGLAKTTVELLSWLGLAAGEEAFRRLAEEQVTPNRMLLVRLLTQLGSAGMEAARRRLDDERWYVVRNACVVLGDLDDPELPQRLRGALRQTESRVQQAAVTALVKSHAPGAMLAIADALPGLEAGIVEKALEELSFRKDPATLDGLEKFLHLCKGTKTAALDVAVHAVGVISSERAARVLGVVLSDTAHAPLVRRAAADCLLRSQQPVARKLLEAYVRVASADPIAAAIQRAFQRAAAR